MGVEITDGGHIYEGQYVATADFDSKSVITASASAAEAHDSAVSQGHVDPVITYIPYL